jgi:sigma-B regulation protein RsbU (phosphoserine phosphatase)
LENTEMYFSVFYGIFDPSESGLSYSNAGHPYAYRLQPAGDVVRMGVTAPPLGLSPDQPFGNADSPWVIGSDMLVLCTDGLIDREAADGEMYGEERLLARLKAGSSMAPEELIRFVLDDVERFSEIARDDVTLLVFRI